MRLNACAKLNLALDISARRADGYHDMRMVMQSVDLCDTLDIELNQSGQLTVDCSVNIEGENLVCTAVKKYSQTAGFEIGGSIFIDKHIPVCGGLGGGSADCAAVLNALDMQFGAVDADTLKSIALSLGADVPFAMVGGTQLAEGVGERLTSLKPLCDCFIVLCNGGTKKSTGSMFGKFDRMENQLHPDVDGVAKALNEGDLKSAAGLFANSFEPLWQGDLLDSINNTYDICSCLGHALSGAGSTVFGVFDNDAQAHNCYEQLKKLTGWAYICRPTEKSIMVV